MKPIPQRMCLYSNRLRVQLPRLMPMSHRMGERVLRLKSVTTRIQPLPGKNGEDNYHKKLRKVDL